MITTPELASFSSEKGKNDATSVALLNALRNGIFADLHVAQIAVVTAFDADHGLTVKPVVKDRCVDNDGIIQWVDLPEQSDVPYIPYNNQQPKQGDACLLVYTDTDYSGWYASGGTSVDGSPKTNQQERTDMHSLSNAIAILGLQIKWTASATSSSGGVGTSVISAGTTNNGMGVSDSLIKFIESWEGFVASPDSADAHGVDYWNTTVGYGHVMGDGDDSGIVFPLTPATAEDLLKRDLSMFYIPSVQKEFGDVQLKQNQFDALVNFAYGWGAYIWSKAPTLVNDIKSGAAPDKIQSDFEAFDHCGGQYCYGLLRRLTALAEMFNSGQYISND